MTNAVNQLRKGATLLSMDTRPIKGVYVLTDAGDGWTVGHGRCTGIEAYDEFGQAAEVPWIAVFYGDEIAVRVPANQVSIYYQ